MTRRFELWQPFLFLAVALLCVTTGRYAATSVSLRVTLVALSVPLIVAVGFRTPRVLLIGLVCWLGALGTIRRIVSLGTEGARADALLLVAPMALAILVLVAAQHGAFDRLTPLAKVVLALSVLVLLSTLNPLQGSALAGAAGLLFLLVPMLAFWVGRGLCDDDMMRRIFWLVAAFALVNGIYGLIQMHVGFPSWDQHWLDNRVGYGLLVIGGETRAFGSFSSAAEYTRYLGAGTIIWLVLTRGGRWATFAVPVALLMLVALVYESSRGALVLLSATAGVLLAARLRLSMVAAGAAAVVLVIALFAGVRTLVPDASSPLLAHQVEGLQNPLDPDASTIPGHAKLVIRGIGSIADRPLGSGVGAVTLAGKRFGGFVRQTEADPSNLSVALGLPGFVLWLALALLALRLAYGAAVRRGRGLPLAALGVLVFLFLHWLNGGEYAVAVLPWLILGWLDRRGTRPADELGP